MDNIDKLYQHYDTLSAAKDISQHQKEFEDILAAVKGSEKEKKLVPQFIAQFAKAFPKLEGQVTDAMFDLCEDEDVMIRKLAIKSLVTICKDNKEAIRKIAFALGQILQSDDPTEVAVVHTSLTSLYQLDPLATLAALFTELAEENETMRERTLKMLAMKLRSMGKETMQPEVKEYVIQECKKILEDVTADEFVLVMAILGQCKMSDTVSGQQQLVDLVAQQCNLTQTFNPKDQEHLDRMIICIKHALPYFSTQVKSTTFISYICDQVLPHRAEIVGSSEQKLDIFKLLAELSTNCGALEPATERIQTLYQTLLEYMPLPPPVEETNGVESSADEVEPRLEFTYVESLMYAFHQLARQNREFLTEDAERIKDFRARLTYFARGAQGYMKKLRESLQVKTDDQMKDENSRITVTALRTTTNINILIRDLFRNPPSYKAIVTLSFKPVNSQAKNVAAAAVAEAEAESTGAPKRHAPITFESSPPKARQQQQQHSGNRQPYVVPNGKFSSNVSSGSGGSRPRGRGGFRGGRGYKRGGY